MQCSFNQACIVSIKMQKVQHCVILTWKSYKTENVYALKLYPWVIFSVGDLKAEWLLLKRDVEQLKKESLKHTESQQEIRNDTASLKVSLDETTRETKLLEIKVGNKHSRWSSSPAGEVIIVIGVVVPSPCNCQHYVNCSRYIKGGETVSNRKWVMGAVLQTRNPTEKKQHRSAVLL